MKRRDFLAAGAATAALGVLPSAFAALDAVEYSPAAYAAALESGKPLLLDFYASW